MVWLTNETRRRGTIEEMLVKYMENDKILFENYIKYLRYVELMQKIANEWYLELEAIEGSRQAIIDIESYLARVNCFFGENDTAATMVHFMRKIRPLVSHLKRDSKPHEDKSTGSIEYRFRNPDDRDNTMLIRFIVATSGKCNYVIKSRVIEEKVYNCANAIGVATPELNGQESLTGQDLIE